MVSSLLNESIRKLIGMDRMDRIKEIDSLIGPFIH
jgi:hypothetical protein